MGLARTAILLTLSASAGCSTCPTAGGRDLQVGTGESAFTALDDVDNTLELVHGPQGGWHVLLAFAATGLAGDAGITVADVEGRVDGQKLASISGQWLALSCDVEGGAWQAWNIFLIFDVTDPAVLHLAPLDITATLTDARGRAAEGAASGTIFDPLALEDP